MTEPTSSQSAALSFATLFGPGSDPLATTTESVITPTLRAAIAPGHVAENHSHAPTISPAACDAVEALATWAQDTDTYLARRYRDPNPAVPITPASLLFYAACALLNPDNAPLVTGTGDSAATRWAWVRLIAAAPNDTDFLPLEFLLGSPRTYTNWFTFGPHGALAQSAGLTLHDLATTPTALHDPGALAALAAMRGWIFPPPTPTTAGLLSETTT